MFRLLNKFVIEMSDKIKAIVVTNECPYCNVLKQRLKQKRLLSKVKIINANTKKGREFAEQHSIMSVPECVVISKNGKQVRVCSPKEFERVLREGR